MKRHGTRTRYSQGCRCDRCRAANTEYARELATGQYRRTDAAPVREHVNALRREGWTLAGLARHTGYHVGTIRKIASGRARQVQVATAEDVLSVGVAA